MTEKKHCERCGKLIGDAYETDFFAYIRMKYCDECKVQVRREKNAQQMKELRRKTREINKAKSEQLELLREENSRNGYYYISFSYMIVFSYGLCYN